MYKNLNFFIKKIKIPKFVLNSGKIMLFTLGFHNRLRLLKKNPFLYGFLKI